MDTVRPLVHAVVRAFYTDEHAIVIDPLLREPYYLEDDNQAKGSLSKAFGWIASKRIRQLLDTLVDHSLVQKKEIAVGINLDTLEVDGTSRRKRDFYYVDFVHFIKIITLRFHQMSKFIFKARRESVVVEWTCFPQCDRGRVFTMLDAARLASNAQTGQLLCPTCGSELLEREQVPTATSEQSFEGVNEKFRAQLAAELDFRDGLQDLLTRAHNLGTDLPDNDPAKKLKALENASRVKRARMQSEAERAAAAAAGGGGQDEEEEELKRAVIDAADKEMPAWFKKTLGGEATEDAIQDEKQRALRGGVRAATASAADANQDEYVLRYEQEMLAKAKQAEETLAKQAEIVAVVDTKATMTTATEEASYPVFTFKSGEQVVKRPDDPEEKWDALLESCPSEEYEDFVKFLS